MAGSFHPASKRFRNLIHVKGHWRRASRRTLDSLVGLLLICYVCSVIEISSSKPIEMDDGEHRQDVIRVLPVPNEALRSRCPR